MNNPSKRYSVAGIGRVLEIELSTDFGLIAPAASASATVKYILVALTSAIARRDWVVAAAKRLLNSSDCICPYGNPWLGAASSVSKSTESR